MTEVFHYRRPTRLLQPVKLSTISVLSAQEQPASVPSASLIHVRQMKHLRRKNLLHNFYATLDPADRHLSLYEVYKQSQKCGRSRRPTDPPKQLMVGTQHQPSPAGDTFFSNQVLSRNCSPPREVGNVFGMHLAESLSRRMRAVTNRYQHQPAEPIQRINPLHSCSTQGPKVRRRKIVSIRQWQEDDNRRQQ